MSSGGTKRKMREKTRDRGYALQEIDNLSDDQFRRMFRLNRPSFDLLLVKIIPFMPIFYIDHN